MAKVVLKRLLRWLSWAERIMRAYFATKGVVLTDLDPHWLIALRSLRAKVQIEQADHHAWMLSLLAYQCGKLDGDMADVGGYKGGSTLVIHQAAPHKLIHAFDSLSGLPELSEHDDPRHFQPGDYATKYLWAWIDRDYAMFYPGWFPETAQSLQNTQFCFVHLDMDLYQSTKDGLEFFYPRMVKGGVIVIHDHTTTPGITKAVYEFFQGKPEIIIEPYGKGQAVVVKL